MNEEQERLILRYLDGSASPEDVRTLDALLRSNADARRALLESAELDAQLAQLDDEPAVAEQSESGIRRRRDRHSTRQLARRRHGPWGYVAAAAVALLCVTAVWFGNTPAPAGQLTLAPVMGQIEVDGQAVGVGLQALSAGATVNTAEQAVADLRFADGTTITLQPNTSCRVTSVDPGKHLELAAGRMSAEVQPQPQGAPLQIHTPNAQVTVVGTRFALRTQGADFTRLDVHSGVVRMTHGGASHDVAAAQTLIASPRHAFVPQEPAPTRAPDAISLTLVDPESKQAIEEFDPMPPEAVIRLSALETRKLNMRLNNLPEEVEAVRIMLNGKPFGRGGNGSNAVERHRPFMIVGDDPGTGRLYGWKPEPGEYRLRVEFFTDQEADTPAGLEEFTHTFSVIE